MVTLRRTYDCFNGFTWNVRADGVKFPSRRADRPDADPPTGATVVPGTYTLHLTYGKTTSTTSVVVHADPRIDYPAATWDNRAKAFAEVDGIVKSATAGFDRLQDVRTAIGLVEKALVNAPDSVLTDLKKQGKALKDSIGRLE